MFELLNAHLACIKLKRHSRGGSNERCVIRWEVTYDLESTQNLRSTL